MGSFDYAKPAKRVTYVNKPSTIGTAVGPVYLLQVKGYTVSAVPELRTVLSIEGSGAINLAACVAMATGADTAKFKITIDGNVIFSASYPSTTQYYGAIAIGAIDNSGYGCSFQRIPFEKSAKFEAASSLSQQLKCYIDYELTQ